VREDNPIPVYTAEICRFMQRDIHLFADRKIGHIDLFYMLPLKDRKRFFEYLIESERLRFPNIIYH